MSERFVRERRIGRGSFGEAWLVSSRSSGRRYVMKEVQLGALSEEEVAAAVGEAQILARCRHSSIVRYKEYHIVRQPLATLYLVMEYADGGDLSERVQEALRNRVLLREPVVLDWFVQVLFAVQYLHRNHILHRDLKTQNIFLTQNNLVKVGDFGIARCLRDKQDLATTAIGTPYYLSPEICRRRAYNHKSDMWALGCVLYELCALTHPFHAHTFQDLLLAILRGSRPPLPSMYSRLTQGLTKVLLRPEPERRPTADELLHLPGLRPYVRAYLAKHEQLLGARASSSPASSSPASSSPASSPPCDVITKRNKQGGSRGKDVEEGAMGDGKEEASTNNSLLKNVLHSVTSKKPLENSASVDLGTIHSSKRSCEGACEASEEGKPEGGAVGGRCNIHHGNYNSPAGGCRSTRPRYSSDSSLSRRQESEDEEEEENIYILSLPRNKCEELCVTPSNGNNSSADSECGGGGGGGGGTGGHEVNGERDAETDCVVGACNCVTDMNANCDHFSCGSKKVCEVVVTGSDNDLGEDETRSKKSVVFASPFPPPVRPCQGEKRVDTPRPKLCRSKSYQVECRKSPTLYEDGQQELKCSPAGRMTQQQCKMATQGAIRKQLCGPRGTEKPVSLSPKIQSRQQKRPSQHSNHYQQETKENYEDGVTDEILHIKSQEKEAKTGFRKPELSVEKLCTNRELKLETGDKNINSGEQKSKATGETRETEAKRTNVDTPRPILSKTYVVRRLEASGAPFWRNFEE